MELPESKRRKIVSALTGVSIAENWPPNEGAVKLAERLNPASYLVKGSLEQLYGRRLPTPLDKSAWAIPVSFRGALLEVSDWRRYSWTIYGLPDQVEVAELLTKKLTSAATVLDRALQDVCRELLSKEDFSLDNQFHRYRTLFEEFAEKCGSIRLDRRVTPAALDAGDIDLGTIAKHLEHAMNIWTRDSTELRINLIASAIFFFSLSEIIFDACFALGDRSGTSYRRFRALDWAERFKFFIPLSGREVQELYEQLLKIRRFYRNIPVHASPLYVFHIDGFGLIPATFEDLENPNLSPLFSAEPNDAEEISTCLVSALEFLERNPTTEFGFAYAESGLAIHLSETRLSKFKIHMGSIEEFRDFLQVRADYADAVMNMDV
jgi:hypothetical protein